MFGRIQVVKGDGANPETKDMHVLELWKGSE